MKPLQYLTIALIVFVMGAALVWLSAHEPRFSAVDCRKEPCRYAVVP